MNKLNHKTKFSIQFNIYSFYMKIYIIHTYRNYVTIIPPIYINFTTRKSLTTGRNNHLKQETMRTDFARAAVLILAAVLMNSCSVVTGIFKAGMGIGIAVVVIILLIIFFIISKVSGNKK